MESKVRAKPSPERDLISATVMSSAKERFLVAEEENLIMSVASGMVPEQSVQLPASEKLSELVPNQTQVLPAALDGNIPNVKLISDNMTPAMITTRSEEEDDIFELNFERNFELKFFPTQNMACKNMVTKPLGPLITFSLMSLLFPA